MEQEPRPKRRTLSQRVWAIAFSLLLDYGNTLNNLAIDDSNSKQSDQFTGPAIEAASPYDYDLFVQSIRDKRAEFFRELSIKPPKEMLKPILRDGKYGALLLTCGDTMELSRIHACDSFSVIDLEDIWSKRPNPPVE